MYKVLVVEDEDIIRKGLVFSIPWEEFDCTVIDSCANGQGGDSSNSEHASGYRDYGYQYADCRWSGNDSSDL